MMGGNHGPRQAWALPTCKWQISGSAGQNRIKKPSHFTRSRGVDIGEEVSFHEQEKNNVNTP